MEKIGAIWFDGWWDQDQNPDFDWQPPGQYAMIHRLQPACFGWEQPSSSTVAGEDIQIFERDLPGENRAGPFRAGYQRLAPGNLRDDEWKCGI